MNFFKIFSKGEKNNIVIEYDGKNNISFRDLYEQYWHCRDFEIKNLWQRSIFLGTFLVLCFTGYGAFLGKAFLGEAPLIALNTGNCSFDHSLIAKHLIALFLTIIGSLFAWLWIAMAKASKAWVETYERAIYIIEQKMAEESPLADYISFNYHKFPDYHYYGTDTMFDNKISSTKGGYFSPSRLNIVLGQIALAIWGIIEFIHLIFLFRMLNVGYCVCTETPLIVCVLLALLIILAQFGAFSGLKNVIKSETLYDKDPKRKQQR